MVNRINTVDTIRHIDQILHSKKNTVYSNSEYAKLHPVEISNTNETVRTEFENVFSEEFSNEELNKLVEQAKKMMTSVNRQMTFRIHEGTGRPLIQLIESDTNEVVREIPPEKMLDIVAGIWNWAGLVVDRKE